MTYRIMPACCIVAALTTTAVYADAPTTRPAHLRHEPAVAELPAEAFKGMKVDVLCWLAGAGSHDARLHAIEELGSRGTTRPENGIVPGIFRRAMDDPAADICRAGAYALWQWGEEGAVQWFDAARSPDGYTRRLAISALAEPGLNHYFVNGQVIAILDKAADDPDPLISAPAIDGLLNIRPTSTANLAGLAKRHSLKGDQPDRFVTAAADAAEQESESSVRPALGEAGEKIMIAAINDEFRAVRVDALRWAATLREPPKGLVAALARSLVGPSPNPTYRTRQRTEAARLLGQFQSEPEISVPALISFASEYSGTPVAEREAVRALRKFGPKAAAAANVLNEIVRGGVDNPLKLAAASALVSTGQPFEEGAVRSLIGIFESPDDVEQRFAVIDLIAAIGPGASGAVSPLKDLLDGSDNELRIAAADALGAIGPPANPAIPKLLRMADNRFDAVRQSALAALAKICPTGEGLTPALAAAVVNRDLVGARLIIGSIHSPKERKKALARLARFSDDPDPVIQRVAAQATAMFDEESVR